MALPVTDGRSETVTAGSGNHHSTPAAVVGSAGFIGSHLAAALSAAGIPTAAFTRSDPPVVEGRPAPGLGTARVVYYMASSVTPATAENRPDLIAQDHNCLVRLLDGLALGGGRPSVVLASSGANGTLYDPDAAPPYREESPIRPTTAHGRAKLRQERELLSRFPEITPVVLRLANTYGPGQRARSGLGVIAHWLNAAVAGEPLRVFGSPDVARDYVYVGDVVDAMLKIHSAVSCAADPGSGLTVPYVINIGSGVPVTLRELLAVTAEVVDRPLRVRFEPPRSFDRPLSWLSTDAAARHLHWKAQTPLNAGIRRAWRAVASRHQ